MTNGIDFTQFLGTAATVLGLSLGVALMIVLAVVPLWLRYDAEPAHPARRTPAPAPARPTVADRHALAA